MWWFTKSAQDELVSEIISLLGDFEGDAEVVLPTRRSSAEDVTFAVPDRRGRQANAVWATVLIAEAVKLGVGPASGVYPIA